MSRCYLDTNFIYAHLRSGRDAASQQIESWRARVLEELETGDGVISALVLDELAYRLTLAWLRDDGDSDPLSTYRANPRLAMRAARHRLTSTWRAVDSLALELQPTDHAVVEKAKTLMDRSALAPRDAFHAAHALEARCSVIVSSDTEFEQVSGLRPLAP